MILWAHIDDDGKIKAWGASSDEDVFRQPLPPGLTAIARPADVTGYDKVRYVDGVWVREEEE